MIEAGTIAKRVSEVAADTIAELVGSGAIDRSALLDHAKASKANLHGWLQYALIRAASQLGLQAVPEVRVELQEPLIPEKLLEGRKGKKRRQKRIDVGFFVDGRFVGFGECFTLDEFHGCLSTAERVSLVNELAGREVIDVHRAWITPGDTIMHMAENARSWWRPHIAILVLTLPDDFRRAKLGSYIDHRILLRKGAGFFVERWVDLVRRLRVVGVSSHMLRITDVDVRLDETTRVFFSKEELEKRIGEWSELVLSLEAEPSSELGEEGWKWMSDEYAERKLGLR